MIIIILVVFAIGTLFGIYLEKNFQLVKKNNNNEVERKEEKNETV